MSKKDVRLMMLLCFLRTVASINEVEKANFISSSIDCHDKRDVDVILSFGKASHLIHIDFFPTGRPKTTITYVLGMVFATSNTLEKWW